MFDFTATLEQYEEPITILVPGTGGWDPDSGQWVEGEDTEDETAAPVVPLTNDDLTQDEGGSYTAKDRKMYIHQELQQGQTVKVGDDEYTVDAEKDYSFHASGLRIYIIVRKG